MKIIKTVSHTYGPFWTSVNVSYSPDRTQKPRRPRLADRFVAACPTDRADIAHGRPAIGALDLTSCNARRIAKDNARHYADPHNRPGRSGKRQVGSYTWQLVLSDRKTATSGPWDRLP